MSVIEALQYLSRSDTDDEDDDSEHRPTPLDPEYWRGITHSYDAIAPHAVAVQQEYDGGFGYPTPTHAEAEYPQLYSRPLTAPAHMGGAAAFGSGTLIPSPINFSAGDRQVPISPLAHADRKLAYGENPMARSYAGGFASLDGVGLFAHESRQGYDHAGGDWGHPVTRGGGYAPTTGGVGAAMSPQSLRAEIRSAFVRARAYLDLVPFFQSCDHSYSGAISLRSLQEALLRMGVTLTTIVLHGVGQLFGIPGSGLIDYAAFSRFLELDGHELCVLLTDGWTDLL